nr:hypothetical protein [Tanacetum cinerariifolium]
ADHAGCQDTRRSTSGSVQFLGERLISWSSKRQKSAAISSTEVLLPYAAIMSNTLGLSISTSDTTLSRSRDRIEFLINKLGMRSFTPETLKQLMDEVDDTMDTTIEQQAAMDEALVPHAQRDTVHICPRVHGQSFDEPPFEEEILAFIRFLGRTIINKCLTGKSSGYDSLRLSQAQILRTRSSSDTSITPSTTAASPRLTTSVKGKQTAKASKSKSLSALSEVAMTEAQQLKLITKRSMHQTHISQASGSGADEGTGADTKGKDSDDDEKDEGDDGEEGDGDDDEDDNGEEGDNDDAGQEVKKDDDKDDEEEGGDDDQEFNKEENAEETRNEESFDLILRTHENSDDEGNDDEDLGLNIGGEEGHIEEEEEDELYRDVNINQGRGIQATLEVEDSHVTLTPANPDGQQQSSSVSSQFVTSMLNSTLNVGMESIFETTSQMDAHTPTSVAPLPMTAPTMTPSTIATITTTSQAPILSKTVPSNIIQNLPSFGLLFGFDNRPRTLEANFYEFKQMNQFAGAVSAIPGIVQRYMDQRINEAVKVKIIKEQVKEQVKVQVSKILPSIEQTVNEQLEAEVLTRSSHSSKTSYAVAADLLEMELKKFLIEKMEGNKRDDDADKDEEPSAGPDRGLKRRIEGKELESASAPSKTATRSADRSTQVTRSRQASVSEYAFAKEPMQTTFQMEKPSHSEFETGAEDQPILQSSQHPEWFSQQQKPPSLDRDWNKTVPATYESIQPWISELAKRSDSCFSFNKLMDTPLDFSNFLINRLKVDTLTLELLAGPTYELLKGSCKSLVELEYHLEEVFKATTYQLDWVNPEGVSSRKYTTSITKMKATDYGHIKWIEDLVPRTMWIKEPIGYDKHALWGVSHWGRKHQQFYGFVVNRESARDVYSKRRIIAVTELKIVEWHNYKYSDWIMVRRDDDKLYKFKEGDFKRLRIQDIEDMLLLLVQGKLTNLTVEERFAFNVSIQMFTRSIVIQRRVEDLQLGVESSQKKLNLTKPYSYRSDLKRKEAYTTYSNPHGFIYQNKNKKNRLMWIDELHKFSDGTLTDVRTALDDRLKGIRMRYLP